MANILTVTEAANVLRCDQDDPVMLDLLPQVDAYIKNATGWDWAKDVPVRSEAKSAARLVLISWHEDPGGMAAGTTLGWGLRSALTQLEAIAQRFVEIEGINGSGYICLDVAQEGDLVVSVTGLTAGHTGDQSSQFETVISEEGMILQTGGNLDDCYFRVELKPLREQ